MEHQEALQSGALIGQFANAVQYHVDDFLPDGVMAASVVIGGVLFAGDQLFGMKQLAVSTSANLEGEFVICK